MKTVTKRNIQVNFHQLIEHVWNFKLPTGAYTSVEGEEVFIERQGVSFEKVGNSIILSRDKFIVEIEEPIDKNTIFHGLFETWFDYGDNEIESKNYHEDISINEILRTGNETQVTLAIYERNSDGTIGEMVYDGGVH